MSIVEEITQTYVDRLAELFANRYNKLRRKISKSCSLLRLILDDYKRNRPEIFRSYVRMEPDCFDALVEAIRDDPVFQNDSRADQMPVEEQLAIALYRFGHYGNAASTLKVRGLV